MADVAQELDDEIMDIVRDHIIAHTIADEIQVACLAVDIIHGLNEAGYLILKRDGVVNDNGRGYLSTDRDSNR